MDRGKEERQKMRGPERDGEIEGERERARERESLRKCGLCLEFRC
jgi:hypothetical protein